MQAPYLIFDFDGTIADTHLFLIEIYNSFCEEYNYKKIDIDRADHYKHKNARQMIRLLNIDVFKIPTLIARAKKHYHEDIEKIMPFDGLREVLGQLKQRGHTIGIVSSNTMQNITKFLENHNLKFFDFIHSTNRIFSKNSVIKKLIKKLGLLPENVVYVGDEIRDIEAAKRLGIRIIAVSWGYNSKKALEAKKPDYLVHSPHELLSACDRL